MSKHTPKTLETGNAHARQRRCAEGYGVKTLRLMRAAKARGMHLRADGALVLPTGKVHDSKPHNGRKRVNLAIDGENSTISVARIVCFLAHGEPPTPNSVTDHIDGDTLNDAPENLRWATYSENTRNSRFSRKKTFEQAAAEACTGIPTNALKEGVVKELAEAIVGERIRTEIRGYKDYTQRCRWCDIALHADPPENHKPFCLFTWASTALASFKEKD